MSVGLCVRTIPGAEKGRGGAGCMVVSCFVSCGGVDWEEGQRVRHFRVYNKGMHDKVRLGAHYTLQH